MKNLKLLLVTNLIFCSNLKVEEKSYLLFCQESQGDARFWFGLHKCVITAALGYEYDNHSASTAVISGASLLGNLQVTFSLD